MPHFKKLSFSSDGKYVAHVSHDGVLRVFETFTNTLNQEFIHHSHLSSTYTTVEWYPTQDVTHPAKRHKKEKISEDFSVIKHLQLIAIGTLNGEILLYSYKNADLYSCLTNGHNGIINDVCWCTSTGSIFSCSSDKNIIIWDVFTGKIKMKWKGDNISVHSICLINSSLLLSASNSIKLWNIEKKSVIKTFTGHASEIFILIPLKIAEETQNSFFVSAAVGDRVINVWQLQDENKSAVASFLVPDEPETISVFSETNKLLQLGVVCKDGSFHLFQHVLNGFEKKSICSKLCVQIASKSKESQRKLEKLPILCAFLSLGLSSSLISYGNFLRPTFEKIDFTSKEYTEVSNIFLIRDLSIVSAVSEKDDVTRIKCTDKSEKIKVLVPGHLTPGKAAKNAFRKRMKKELCEQEFPLEKHLQSFHLCQIAKQDSEHQRDMVHLLLQGLQSRDNNMMNTVLQSNDERIIQNTIERLPLQSIILLLKELHIRLSRKEQSCHPYIKWIKCLLSIHLPYLMSHKDIGEYLDSTNEIIQARIENFPKMCQLHGCLKILLSQTTTAKLGEDKIDKPSVVYESDSSSGFESDDEENYSDDMESSDEEV